MKSKLLLFLCIICCSNILHTQNFNFAKAFYGGSSYGRSIVVDKQKNSYIAGDFSGLTDFDPSAGTYTLNSGTAAHIFVSKLDSIGNLIWVKEIGTGNNGGSGFSIAVDNTGNVIVLGTFKGTVDFDPGPSSFFLTNSSPSSVNLFVLKLTSNGDFILAKHMEGIYDIIFGTILCDATNNICFNGSFTGNVDFDPSAGTYPLSSTPNGAFDAYICKLDSNGNFLWAKVIGGTGFDSARSIALDATGNIYSIGTFNGTVDFDPGVNSYTYTSVSDGIFVSKLDPQGNFMMALKMSGSGPDVGRAIKLDNTGNIYITGHFGGQGIDFDPGPGSFTANPVGNADLFVSKINSLGNLVWVKQMPGDNFTHGAAISLDPAGNIYVAGMYAGTTDFDPGIGTFTLGSYGIYVTKLDGNGNFGWANKIDYLNGGLNSGMLDVDASGSVYTTGSFSGLLDFDPSLNTYTLNTTDPQNPTAPATNAYVYKLSSCILPEVPIQISSSSLAIVCSGNTTTLGVSATHNVAWYTSTTPAGPIATGTIISVTPSGVGIRDFYVFSIDNCGISTNYAIVTLTVEACTGIESLAIEKNMTLYPNPTNGLLEIVLPNIDNIRKIQLYNSIGILISETTPRSQQQILNLENQPNGIYVVKILSSDKNQIIKKVIKE
jgi:hypothetical protein